jgi:hypothetical protein
MAVLANAAAAAALGGVEGRDCEHRRRQLHWAKEVVAAP